MAEFRNLSAEPAADGYLASFDTFDADVWSDADSLARTCKTASAEELRQMLGRALHAHDLKRALIVTRATPPAKPITRAQAYLAAQALLGQRRYAEAAATLARGQSASFAPNVRHVLARIRALAGAGDLDAAHQAAQAALTAQSELDLRGLPEALQTIRTLAPRMAELAAWADLELLAEAYVRLELDQPARMVLKHARQRLGSGFTGEDLISWARLSLRVAAAETVAAYLEKAPAAPRRDDRWRTLSTAARALSDPPMPPGPGESGPAEDPTLRFWRSLASERRGDNDGAIMQLCALGESGVTDLPVRGALARCVGRLALQHARPRFAAGRTGRIVNVLPFFNELAMLQVHLEEMAPWVDRFVIVEAAKTFTGMDKPLLFEANRRLFDQFADKIVHVPIRELPALLTTPWAREFYQRDMAIAGASELCGEDDYILETDVDEIIDRNAIKDVEADFVALELNQSKFFLNYRPAPGNPQRTALKSTLFKAKHLTRHGLSYCRMFLAHRYPRAHVVQAAGWHFTSMFDAPGMSLKSRSYAHQEHAKDRFRSIPHFQALRDRLRAGKLDPQWERVDIDGSFPGSLHRHLDDFNDVIL